MLKRNTVGWDIGGAHLKAVLIDSEGIALQAIQVPCPLWQGINELNAAFDAVLSILEVGTFNSAFTMTGELADCFLSRQQGVCDIADAVCAKFGEDALFYGGKHGFVQKANITQHVDDVASMNWHASATYLSQFMSSGLLVDIGSTTTDIVPIYRHELVNQGMTDAERMSCDELLYTGVVRTPLMALTNKVIFNGKQYNAAAELFATTGDVYRLLGELPNTMDVAATADGQSKSYVASARRIARMIGHDVEDAPMREWATLATEYKHTHMQEISQNIKVKAALTPDAKTITCAGIGRFLLEKIAIQLSLDYQDISTFVHAKNADVQNGAIVCLPAYAVARLMHATH